MAMMDCALISVERRQRGRQLRSFPACVKKCTSLRKNICFPRVTLHCAIAFIIV